MLDTIGLSLFFSNYRKDVNLYLNPRIRPKAKRALVNISEIQALYKEIAKQIKVRNNRTALYNYKKRKSRP